MAKILDIYAVQATLSGVEQFVANAARLQQSIRSTTLVMGALGLAGITATERLLRESVKLGFQLEKVSGGLNRVWGIEGPAMVAFMKDLAVQTGFAVEELMRAGIALEGLTLSSEKTRTIMRVATDIGAAMELTSQQVQDIALSLGRLGDPNTAARALIKLRRLGLPLQGLTAETPNLQQAVLARLQARYAGALGAFQELDSIIEQLTQTVKIFLADTAGPILRLAQAVAQPGRETGLLQVLVRANQLSHGWFGLRAILALGVTSTYLFIRALLQLSAALKGLQIVAQQAAAATATAAGAQAASTAASKFGGAAIVSRIPFIGAALAALLAAWGIWDVVQAMRGGSSSGDKQNAANQLRRIGDNTEQIADSMKEVAQTLIGAGERAKRLGATMELQIALNRAIATGVG